MSLDKKSKEMKESKSSSEEVIEVPVGKYLSSLRNNPWRVSTIVLLILLLGVVFFSPFSPETSASVSANEAGQNALNFINSNPNLEGEVALVSVQEDEGFYKAVIDYQGQQVPVYLTIDGEYLLTGRPVSVKEPIPIQEPSFDTEAVEIVEATVDDDPVLGNANAPITIIEFSDYQCPFCQRFWSQTLPQIREKYIETGKVKLIYRDFPLSIHQQAQISAEAAECVREKGGNEKYFEYHDTLFENQAQLNKENLIEWADKMGYDITDCLNEKRFGAEVQSDLEDGVASGVSGTPSFFINGVQVEGAQPFSIFEQIIEAELNA